MYDEIITLCLISGFQNQEGGRPKKKKNPQCNLASQTFQDGGGILCLGFVFVLRRALTLLRLALNFWSCYLHHVLLRNFWGQGTCIRSSDSRKEEVPKPSFFFPHLHHTLETSVSTVFSTSEGLCSSAEDRWAAVKEGGGSWTIYHNIAQPRVCSLTHWGWL